MTWIDGTVYKGEWINGRPQGKGKMTWPDGSNYDGNWRQGAMENSVPEY